jgi:hypothetical protein
MNQRIALACVTLLGCGDDGGGTAADAAYVPPMITISGNVMARTTVGSTALEGVVVGAYRVGNDAAPEFTGTSDADGNYAIEIVTGGVPLDGYLRASHPGYLDTYVYPPWPVAQDFDHATVFLLTESTFDLVANTLCGANQQATNGTVVVLVLDADRNQIGGATVASSPAASRVCYNDGGIPNRNATTTADDGIGYMFNLTGQVTVTAMKPGMTFPSHRVTARAGAFTTTLVVP